MFWGLERGVGGDKLVRHNLTNKNLINVAFKPTIEWFR